MLYYFKLYPFTLFIQYRSFTFLFMYLGKPRCSIISEEIKSTSRCWRLRRRQIYHKQSDWRCWVKQSKKDRVNSTTSRASRGFEQTKARKIETETCLQRAERLEALSKTKQDLRLTQRQLVNNEKCNVSFALVCSAKEGWPSSHINENKFLQRI